ncbi:MAG TPA: ABC transporter permease [Steroidobacteraceae bacterium]|jgi:ABC-2 type transport system permease protein|nr:ABC transporter permease [Steroidobacteraceae bacterium]
MRDLGAARPKLRRVLALVKKETRQMIRDPATIAVGIVLPVILILLFGFGLSLDVKNVPVAVVLEESSAPAADLLAALALSPYFQPQVVYSPEAADRLMRSGSVDGILTIPPDFARRLSAGNARVQVVVHGTDANRARIIESYVEGAVGAWSVRQAADEGVALDGGPVTIQSRMWFNSANDSHYFLVPGLIVLVMTLIGAFLTAMVVAREWERGTFEALFVTPVRSGEILLGKTIPYFGLGVLGLLLCVASSKFLFHVPIVGSMAVLLGASMLYVLVALGVGLLISSYFKNQLVASQLTMLATFMPALMLSGFLFDLRSMPLGVRVITYLLPARYYVALLQTAFLAGDIWSVILPNAAVLTLMVALLGYASRAVTHKRIG